MSEKDKKEKFFSLKKYKEDKQKEKGIFKAKKKKRINKNKDNKDYLKEGFFK